MGFHTDLMAQDVELLACSRPRTTSPLLAHDHLVRAWILGGRRSKETAASPVELLIQCPRTTAIRSSRSVTRRRLPAPIGSPGLGEDLHHRLQRALGRFQVVSARP